MALYSIAFSLSHIFSHNVGMQLVAKFGFDTTWMLVTAFAFVGVLILMYLLQVLKNEVL